ncbi:hypothetical protein Aros01_07053 [Streptosporangium roseum]
MPVTEMLKLAPSAEQGEALPATMRACDVAANHTAEVAFEHRTANKIALQKLVYADLRAEFGLSAQMAIRSIAKACEAYKRDKKIKPVFRESGAVAYDQRILSWKGRDRVGIKAEAHAQRPAGMMAEICVASAARCACEESAAASGTATMTWSMPRAARSPQCWTLSSTL